MEYWEVELAFRVKWIPEMAGRKNDPPLNLHALSTYRSIKANEVKCSPQSQAAFHSLQWIHFVWQLSSVAEGIVFNYDMDFPRSIKTQS